MKAIEQQYTPPEVTRYELLQVTKGFVTYIRTKSLGIEDSKEYL
jgi:hypothetical protein